MTITIALFGSGEGSSIQFILNSLKSNLLDRNSIRVSHVVASEGSGLQNYLSQENNSDTDDNRQNNNILDYSSWIVSEPTSKISSDADRLAFETSYRKFWTTDESKPSHILLLGWKYILTKDILDFYTKEGITVLNMHPALPNTFVGNNCADKTYIAYEAGSVNEGGSMIHRCIPELDKGEVVDFIKFPIIASSVEMYRSQVKFHEKQLIYSCLNKLVNEHHIPVSTDKYTPFYIGKVRDVTDIGYNMLVMTATDRISAFNRHLSNVPLKGCLLNAMSAWWFNNTKHIIPNHYVYHQDRHMVVKKCNPIKLEIVVRAYMTGSSSTSIWKRYNAGERTMYGLDFRDGYTKNEPLDEIVITPTTKGDVDEPLTKAEIVSRGYLNCNQRNYVYEKALELFNMGTLLAKYRGLLLVDTKYEFGFYNDEIILMDEIHTCDSSRYWKADSFESRLAADQEPEKYDKDCIRDFVKQTYSDDQIDTLDQLNIPLEVVNKVTSVYKAYWEHISGNEWVLTPKTNILLDTFVESYLTNDHRQLVVILAGSVTDKVHVEKIKTALTQQNIYSVEYYKSAHKNTKEVLDILSKYNNQKKHKSVVYVTVAGRSNALSGVVASNTLYPVIACPPFKDKMDCFTNINSSLQCPSKVPVLTCLEPGNVALAVRNMFWL